MTNYFFQGLYMSIERLHYSIIKPMQFKTNAIVLWIINVFEKLV